MKLTLATASFLVLCTAASAQTVTAAGGGEHHVDPACKAAIENVCPGVKPGGGRIKDCLKQHNTSFKQLCPQDAGKHKQGGGSSSTTGQSTPAPVAQPPVGQ